MNVKFYQRVEKVLTQQAVQKFQVQGAKIVQGRSVFRHTEEFELFVATQQLEDFQQPVKFAKDRSTWIKWLFEANRLD